MEWDVFSKEEDEGGRWTLCIVTEWVYSVKKIMKVRDECYAHIQNKMKSLKIMVKMEEKCRAELWNEMCSLQMMMPKSP
jgi:hypothetical protein